MRVASATASGGGVRRVAVRRTGGGVRAARRCRSTSERVEVARLEEEVEEEERRQSPALASLRVREVTESQHASELVACAALRVRCFYAYPGAADGSVLFGAAEEAAKGRWLGARRRSEEARMLKMRRLGMHVTCLAASVDLATLKGSSEDALAAGLAEDAAATGAASFAEGAGSARFVDERAGRLCEVLGTLDIHRGERLPGEVLEGNHPRKPPEEAEETLQTARDSYRAAFKTHGTLAGDPNLGRAYIFNVCVSPRARRMGVGSRLLQAAHEKATEMGVRTIYVHVEVDNTGAQALYRQEGYIYEKEEPPDATIKLGRPRRYLMAKHLVAPQGLAAQASNAAICKKEASVVLTAGGP
mmetsp:Transcript_12375/g.40731  ORF Transcript_12375/g.40731 Transcript_12375/m.40731 type:complete len:359 (-) Transcript_12375:23-1099(-)|eukprot:CAMPEP_0170133224 /NCGR_PEP_ID=MMETSP0033_2-20121228/1148_1 /TAXON_ID=195969 /ORGANISM="Dolichomastix tenuilepis, Strain CCMP3274" /LENGTH=358 /DNA_ID=CAMNT_0010368689 /DNA_START=261 /DNA_END=1337 /DNA_ORIENTATION=+